MGKIVVAAVIIGAGVVLFHLAVQDTLGAWKPAWEILKGGSPHR